jgi:hypothetical protein
MGLQGGLTQILSVPQVSLAEASTVVFAPLVE